jgi:quinoprotein glucose dehydrogenase
VSLRAAGFLVYAVETVPQEASPTRLFLTLLLIAGLASAQQSHTTWTDYLGGNDSSHYSALKQIDRSNVNQMELAWTYATGDNFTYGFSPIVVDNIMYVLAKSGALVAIDATSGSEIWTHEFVPPPGAPTFRGAGFGGRGRANRGINYWESKDRSDRRLLIPANNFLEAIDARTGKLIESFGDQGRVDLKQGLGRDPRTIRQIQSNTPGRVFENLVILGSGTGESYISPPGDLRAYDITTGKMAWIFHTVPHPGEFGYDTWPKDAWKYIGGTNTWGEITVDDKRGIAYFPLGSPTYDFYGADRKGANLFSDCLLALDARTGKYLWHFQLTHHDLWDYDAVAAPQLVTVKHNGRNIDAVAQAGKQGFLYVFDRVTGKPLWPIEEKPVPKTDMPGEAAWPTQPFPTVPPPFARQKFTADDLNNFILTPEERARWKDRILSARNEGLYTPPGLRETIQMPGNNGGGNFWGTAADPTNGTVYVVTKNAPAFLKLVDDVAATRPAAGANATVVTPAQLGRAVYEINCHICHGGDLKGSGTAPSLEGVIERRGQQETLKFINTGQGEMPSFSSLPETAMTALLVFLGDPAEAPPDKQPPVRAPVAEVPYPAGLDVPSVRYYTGYGLEANIINPPWSTLTAYDLNTGVIKWQAPYGDTPEAGPSTAMRGTIFQRSGIVLTAGGLILFASNEGKLRILDKDTGKELRAIDLPNGSQGIPAVYQVDGREYIAICAAGGNNSGGPRTAGAATPKPHVYVAFALPRKPKS